MNDFEIGSHILQSNSKDGIDAYKLGYKQGQADLKKEYEDLIIGLTKEEARRIRQDAIDECIKAITDYCGGLPNNNLISVLEQLKEK